MLLKKLLRKKKQNNHRFVFCSIAAAALMEPPKTKKVMDEHKRSRSLTVKSFLLALRTGVSFGRVNAESRGGSCHLVKGN